MRLLRICFGVLCLAYLAGCATEPHNAMRTIFLNNASQHDPKVIEAIRNEKIIVGMTPNEVLGAWGSPHDRNTSGGAYGEAEQWVYGYLDSNYYFRPKQYVYFEDGKVTSWQTSGSE